MSLTVNTNILSLTAQNNLNQSQKSLNTAIERLSSGSKINSAKDDAAGQAIANRLTSQIRGLNQASSNANDGISLAQTTEGALNQVNDNLQRIRQLSVQAANGTNSSSDLQSIQKEISQRLAEINRVSQQTAFNGTKVLDGSKSSISIQVGSQDGQTISINLQSVDSNSL
ncbi:MAG: flagellin FliC, partial [Salinisphaera sp.]|nr:flagellin FliC [Salinisphaera sp.]